MYVVSEYLAYVVGIAVLSGILFGATSLFLITQATAKRLSETLRKVAAHAIHLVTGRLSTSRSLRPGSPQDIS